jgi:hypothetical protein
LFDPGEAGVALLGGIDEVVDKDLLVRTTRPAHRVTALGTLGFVDEHHAVFCPLGNSLEGAGLGTAGFPAVVAMPGKVEKVGIRVLSGTDVLVPVWSPGGLLFRGQMDLRPLASVEHLLVVELHDPAEVFHSGLFAKDELSALVIASAHFLPVLWVAPARHGVYLHPPHVVHALIVGPEDFAGHGTGPAAHALVEVNDKAKLPLNFSHFTLLNRQT